MIYKAVEKYYNDSGRKVESLCGFGYCSTLQDAKSKYRGDVVISEITENDLQKLKASRYTD